MYLKGKNGHKLGEGHFVRAQVWYQVGIDIVGPLTLTRNKNRYQVTCTTYFSKWPEAQALLSKCAEESSEQEQCNTSCSLILEWCYLLK
ncbi:hypothetical protein EMCRGX_G020775 [Ephydatia muelleri]